VATGSFRSGAVRARHSGSPGAAAPRGNDGEVECICRGRRRRLDGDAAVAYATGHLQKVWSDHGDLIGLACPDTGVLWVLDTWPGDDLLGFAPTRLRVVEPELWESAQRGEATKFLAWVRGRPS
jgi:hypothetical protein